MVSSVQNLDFSRYIYTLKYSCPNTFNEFVLLYRLDIHSSLAANRYEMANTVQIEPFKGINSNTKGAKLYFTNYYPHDPKDETGMFTTHLRNTYFGDLKFLSVPGDQKKVLVFFQIIPEEEQLIVDVFDDFYTTNRKERNALLDTHSWHKKSAQKSAQ